MYTESANLFRHYKKFHDMGAVKKSPGFPCVVCEKVMPARAKLEAHMQIHKGELIQESNGGDGSDVVMECVAECESECEATCSQVSTHSS